MKILVTGATGFVGKRLCKALATQGHDLIVLTRSRKLARETIPAPHQAVEWRELENLDSVANQEAFKEIDAVIHLAGESVAAQRWTSPFKESLRKSRIHSADTVLKILKHSGNLKLKVILSASAIGYYGDCGNESIQESHPPGRDFLAQLCQEWEDKLFSATEIQARKVALRIGIVLGRGGGALEKMISTFAAGVAAYLGNGKQWVSWIHVDDLVSLILEAIKNEAYSGPINACSPEPLTQKDLTKKIAHRLHLIGTFPAPQPLLRIALGEFAESLLSSQRISTQKLVELGFNFKYANIEKALEEILDQRHAIGLEEYLSQCWVPQPIEKVFEFFAAAKNLEEITPPWVHFKILGQSTPEIERGTLIDYSISLHGIPMRWRTEISEWTPLQSFMDSQIRGPYRIWKHTHRFTSLRGGTLMEDRVLYQLPLGILGKLVAGSFVRNDVTRIFKYRSHRIFELLS